jgi:hypothetical protein
MKKQGILACTADIRNGYNIFVRYFKGKRPLGRPRYRWEVIKIDLK